MVSETEAAAPAAPTIPDQLPVLPLRGGIVVFPMAVIPLAISQPRSVRLIDEVMAGNRMLVLAAQKDDETEQAGPDDVHHVGTVAVIHQLFRGPQGTLRLVVQGVERVRILEFTSTDPYLIARIEQAPDQPSEGVEVEALRRAVVDLFRRLVSLIEELPGELAATAETFTDPRQVVYLVTTATPLDTETRQEVLELDPVGAKLQRLAEVLQHEIAIRELGQQITEQTQQRMSKAQREYFLREQLRSIQRELGEEEEGDVGDLRKRLDEAGLPEEARREAERELHRLSSVPPASPEHGIIRTYLDWMLTLPWSKMSGGQIDVRKARQVLDEDHYDLEKVKDRILEYLAVKKLREDRLAEEQAQGDELQPEDPPPNARSSTASDNMVREPILCFVGPPGVGKTSLGQSIARSLGRKFIRMSLGGMHDEAEVRGHRRTYIGSMPGRIIQGIKRSESRDPVFMLDEIDKVGADWRGDPSSALLEVLDPAQNFSFMDNYLGVAFDLSQVLFITTANNLDTIPIPLRDRMEILQLSGYTEDEKVAIAQAYLIPKQIQAHGLRLDEISIEPDAVRRIVRQYTREAGVRNLDRELATVCRKVARRIAEGRTDPSKVTADALAEYLGKPHFFEEVAERTGRPGVATGLAWTPTGGDVLFVEASIMEGQDERLILTGMLGDVMKESAQAALSFVRSNADRLGVDPERLAGKTIHIHVPAGATPKDGPSAGVTMTTALASAATGRPVRGDLAMTGEVTLRGKVLPIGGLKEKALAAHRAGIRTVIIPRQNERDLDDIPAELREQLEFVPVDWAEEVLARALEPARSGNNAEMPPIIPATASSKGAGRRGSRAKAAAQTEPRP